MIPRINSKGGRSFKGALAYFTHDLGQLETAERVRFVQCENMLTQDPEAAARVMAWTAENWRDIRIAGGGRVTKSPTTGAVYTLSLSWAEHENPTDAQMISFARRTMKALGVEHHEAVIVGHRDTDHPHVHVVINRVDPVTGHWWDTGNDKRRLAALALAYEREHGVILCPEREENARLRAEEQAKHRRGEASRFIKHEEAERQTNTPEYQAKRQARIEAQRKAAELIRERQDRERAQQNAARDLRADFDNAAARDAEQYRAKDLRRDPREEQELARKAWAEEQARERARRREEAQRERTERAFREREAARRQRLDARRAANWQSYEEKVIGALNEKQTDRREALHLHHAEGLVRFDRQQERRYAQQEGYLRRQVASLEARLEQGGWGGLIRTLTGDRATTAEALEAARERLASSLADKERERQAFMERQRQAREAQLARQAEEYKRKTEQLQALKARQDAAFEARERERAQKLEADRLQRQKLKDDARQEQVKAREPARETPAQTAERERQTREREEQGRDPANDNALGTSFSQAQGRSLER